MKKSINKTVANLNFLTNRIAQIFKLLLRSHYGLMGAPMFTGRNSRADNNLAPRQVVLESVKVACFFP